MDGYLPDSLNLTQHMKIDGRKTILSFWGPASWQVQSVSGAM